MLRGLGRIHVFPADDVGAQNRLQRFFQLRKRPGYEKIKELTGRRHPYEGFCYFHFLLKNLEEKLSLNQPVLCHTSLLPHFYAIF